jgi:WD40 repeat protein
MSPDGARRARRDQICTVSTDGTLRIWQLPGGCSQLFEFDAPGEAATAIAFHPRPSHTELAAGFSNGRLRVFDVPTTTLIQARGWHNGGRLATVTGRRAA